jgi:hypothetical protein
MLSVVRPFAAVAPHLQGDRPRWRTDMFMAGKGWIVRDHRSFLVLRRIFPVTTSLPQQARLAKPLNCYEFLRQRRS